MENEQNYDVKPGIEMPETEKEVLKVPVETLEQYLSDQKLTELSDGQVIDLSICNIADLNELINSIVPDRSRDESEKIFKALIDELGRETAEILVSAYDMHSKDPFVHTAVEDPESQWKNRAIDMFDDDDPDKPKLAAKVRRIRPSKDSIYYVPSKTDQVAFADFPLPASGFRVKVRCLLASDYSMMRFRIANEKVMLNRRIYGTKYTLDTAAADAIILETLMDCVIACNIEGWSKEMLIDLFDDRDFDEFLLRMITPFYLKGYNARFYCTNEINVPETAPSADIDEVEGETKTVVCNGITERNVNLNNMIHYNYSHADRLTDYIRFSGIDKIVNVDDVIEFQENQPLTNNIIKGNGWEIELGTCRTIDRLRENTRNINEIEGQLIRAFDNNYSDDMLMRRISEVMLQEELRNYIPYFKKFRTFTNEPGMDPIVDEEYDYSNDEDGSTKIRNLLAMFSEGNEIELIEEGLEKFLSSNMINIVGYSNIKCSKCGKAHNQDKEKDQLIPMDVKRLFFTIMDQRPLRRAK